MLLGRGNPGSSAAGIDAPAAHQHARDKARPKVVGRLVQFPLHLGHLPQVRPHLSQLLRRRRQLRRFRLEPRVVLGYPQLVPAIKLR